MSLFVNNDIVKIKWPKFKWKTGKKIIIEVEKENKFNNCTEECNNEKNTDCCKNKEEQEIGSTEQKKKPSKLKQEEIDEIIEIKEGSILRIDGEEYQIHIQIIENEIIKTDFIHKKVIDPNGPINKWEYKNAQLKYDKEDNIFYYVLESPKKG